MAMDRISRKQRFVPVGRVLAEPLDGIRNEIGVCVGGRSREKRMTDLKCHLPHKKVRICQGMTSEPFPGINPSGKQKPAESTSGNWKKSDWKFERFV